MSDAVKEIARLQAEYDRLEAEGAEKFGSKARALLEKQLREEMKKKLDAVGGDRDAFKAKKGGVFRALHAAKMARRSEIEAGVSDGSLAPDAAIAELVSLGCEPGVAQAAVDGAMKRTAEIPTAAVTSEPEVQPVEILDPVGAAQPVAREEVYVEPGREDEKPNRRKGK